MTPAPSAAPSPSGENFNVHERVIVAPSVGRFELTTLAFRGAFIDEGQELGVIIGPSSRRSIKSSFAGQIMGVMASDGERVRHGQPVAWLRAP